MVTIFKIYTKENEKKINMADHKIIKLQKGSNQRTTIKNILEKAKL